jgi:hypothetical protein
MAEGFESRAEISAPICCLTIKNKFIAVESAN